MLLGKLLKSVNNRYKKINVKNISFDSRKIKKGDIFFAIEGNIESGFNFINHAIQKGASVIVSSRKFKNHNSNTPILLVKNVRECLSEACKNFYKKKPKNIIAVTGTNGKSSVVDFFYQLLNLNGIAVASIGTLGIISKNYRKSTKLTSVDSLSLHKNLNILHKKKIKYVALEASSHGLEQKRLDNLNIDIGIFTNLSHDHLDYHKNMQSYLNSKMHLFKNLMKKESLVISDEDIKEFNLIKKLKKLKKLTIGKNGDLKIIKIKCRESKQFVKILINSKIYTLEVPLIGEFQIKNLLMAVLAAYACSLSFNRIFRQIKNIKSVNGRLEHVVKLNNNSNIIVDFAHTPDALETSLDAIKKQFKKDIIIVFGCGGERDKKKRYKMGKIAKKYCRKIFITDDNPRNEDPKKIRKDILKGCRKKAVEVANRRHAIKNAIEELKPDEILLVAGKGHENTQDYGNKIIKFADKNIIKEIVLKKKMSFKRNAYKNFNLNKAFNKKKLNNINYSGVSINSKTIKKNNLFFAISGKNTNGHNYVQEAIQKGAIKSIISKKLGKISKNKIIQVKDTFVSLNNLAKFTRNNSYAQIVGITGSVGKTTLKNLINFSLKNYGQTYCSPHSYNNKFGVPISLCNLKNNTKYGVFEIGMDKKGEIDNLSKIIKPEIGVITNISEAHLKNFKTLKDIAKAKAEIINNISENGDIVLNKDDVFFSFLEERAKRKGIKVTSFSFKKNANIYLLNIKSKKDYYILKVVVNKKIYYFNTKHRTKSFISNMLPCISVINLLNLNLKKIKNIFLNFKIPEGRGDIQIIKKFKKKFKFIDESYNANPLSMNSAISNMNFYKKTIKTKKIVFLSDMLELGEKSKKFHIALSKKINKSNIDKVFVYGTHIKETFKCLSRNKKGKIFNNLKDAYHHLGKIIHNNDLLMVKGSNATGLNQFSKNIKRG